MITPYFSSLPRPPGKNSVDTPQLRRELADSGLFRADKHQLYLYDEERHCWTLIPHGNDVLALRSLFPDDEQATISNAKVPEQANWLRELPMIQFDFEAERNPFIHSTPALGIFMPLLDISPHGVIFAVAK